MSNLHYPEGLTRGFRIVEGFLASQSFWLPSEPAHPKWPVFQGLTDPWHNAPPGSGIPRHLIPGKPLPVGQKP